MKLYKNLVNSVAETLQEIFVKNRYADKAIEKVFKQNPQWGSRDRRFVAEAVYDIVRNFRLYSELAQSQKNFWFITAVWLVIKEIEFPDWQEFKNLDREAILIQKEQLKNNIPVYESYPDWLWELGINELGEDVWKKEALAMNTQAQVVLRVNTLKTNTKKLIEELSKTNIALKEIDGIENAVELVKRENVFQNNFFKLGWFEVQDAGSQEISSFLDPKPNQFVIDACAGAGGKSLHIAALMNNKGKLISLDVEGFKLEELKRRAKRAGVFNVETRTIEDSKTIKRLQGKADKLLLDVPCSGLGVIKRNPDAKWKLSLEVIERTKKLQEKILSEYSEMVKVGGELVYSTCSILPSENKQQVDLFLNNNSNFEFVKDKTILPSQGYDGFYMALLKRTS
ncbi:RsmB/NOP family class I SAM-dependent RNA methyltransferase [Sediminibacterium sp.]|uniref:RsmB/NOP family class I SAM-dependent RNA methyltransferase n=1 Tax=Sediminibacterium sp. TaxID=1917865 RepID=UPI0027346AA1|nr:RsmB/NOP family class I SAM-dependent RNA methyltransferase [Sediminibacterium sp.]MDP3567528.1 RsmB/NOP family class I SAM-dependent RNA methyltransferase [Sediminibacterium sp.]